MIEKFDLKNKVYNEYETQHKINELVEAVNKLTKQQTKEPKWKLGDLCYYISLTYSSVKHTYLSDEGMIENINSGKDPNAFKTKEQAQQALNEILQILNKYQ